MPAEKDAAKRRRQARNRQERQNRQARTEGVRRAASRPARTATETPATKTGRPARTSLAKEPATARSGRGGLLGTLFPPRPQPGEKGAGARPVRGARPPSAIVEVDAGPGLRGVLARWLAQPGGRPTVLALLVAVVSAVVVLGFPILPSPDLSGYGETVVRAQVEADGGSDDDVDDAVQDFATRSVETVRGIEFKTPQLYFVMMTILIPILVATLAVRSLLRTTRSRSLMFSAIAAVLALVANLTAAPLMILVPIALGFAAFQSSKADKAALAASG